MSGRRLVSIRRTVEPAAIPRYDRAWDELRVAVTSRGGRAWRFRSAAVHDRYIEFLEFADGEELLGVAEIQRSLDRLRRDFPAAGETASEEWREA